MYTAAVSHQMKETEEPPEVRQSEVVEIYDRGPADHAHRKIDVGAGINFDRQQFDTSFPTQQHGPLSDPGVRQNRAVDESDIHPDVAVEPREHRTFDKRLDILL